MKKVTGIYTAFFIFVVTAALMGMIVGGYMGYWIAVNKAYEVFGTDATTSMKVPVPIPNTESPTSLVQMSENMIYVADQPYRSNLIVSVAYVSEPGFVVIHRANNDIPGVIIGWSDYLTKGENKNIEVHMPDYDSPLPFDKLIAMLHKDNGDTVFNAKEDLPFTDTPGNPIWMMFSIDESASNPRDVQVNF